jgi:hypothetical protein
MPVADVPLQVWGLNFTTLLTAAPATYGLVAGNAVTCAAVYAAYAAALTLALDPSTRTAVTVADKNVAKAAMRATIAPFATQISGNPAVLAADKTAIGVTVRVTTRTRASLVDVPLALTVSELTPTYVEVYALNPDTPDTAKRPYMSTGIEIQQRIRNAADTADEETNVALGTRRYTRVPTPIGMNGRKAFFRARWVGKPLTGGALNLGAWSDEQEVILP